MSKRSLARRATANGTKHHRKHPMTHPMTHILGLHGPAGSGKTHLAQYLCQTYGWKRLSFAFPLRAMLSALFYEAGFDHADIMHLLNSQAGKNEPIPELCGLSPRRLMQTLGTEWGRQAAHPQLWVNLAQNKVQRLKKSQPDLPGIVFDDVRFPNEKETIENIGGVVVGLPTRYLADGTVPDHASEHPLPCPMLTVPAEGWSMKTDGELIQMILKKGQSETDSIEAVP